MKTKRFSLALCLLAACVSPIASAQDYDDDIDLEEEEDESGNRTKTTTTRSTSTTTRIPGTGDHQFVVRKVGVGFMGMLTIPLLDANNLGPPVGTLRAPTIGARYWFDSTLAVEAGIGLDITGSSRKQDKDGSTVDSATGTGIAFRVGVPLSLYDSQHYSFQIIPDFRFAYGKASFKNDSGDPVTTTSSSTTTWGVGASAGAEIYFGFLDIPELSVQGGVGLAFLSSSASTDRSPQSDPPQDLPTSSYHRFGTNLDNEPWDIFTGSIRALYYF